MSIVPRRPPRISPGQRVALIAPAGPLSERDDLARAKWLCAGLGVEPVPGAHRGAPCQRLTALKAMSPVRRPPSGPQRLHA